MKPPNGPCVRCGKANEQRFEQPAYRAINAWLAKLTSQNTPVEALMTIPEDRVGIAIKIDTIDATIDLLVGVQVVRRKKKERPRLVKP